VPEEFRNVDRKNIQIGVHVIVGTGTTILPGADLADGTAIGAMSLVKSPTLAWSVYAGIPASIIRDRNTACLKLVP
jgi:acetyltransferase-like isoleucine patch superfamily enzyme